MEFREGKVIRFENGAKAYVDHIGDETVRLVTMGDLIPTITEDKVFILSVIELEDLILSDQVEIVEDEEMVESSEDKWERFVDNMMKHSTCNKPVHIEVAKKGTYVNKISGKHYVVSVTNVINTTDACPSSTRLCVQYTEKGSTSPVFVKEVSEFLSQYDYIRECKTIEDCKDCE